MKWKLTHKKEHEIIENEGGKTLSYNPNLGIQIIEDEGFAFKDLNGTGKLEPYEDWRLPLTNRVQDFIKQFTLWQDGDCLYYYKGKISIPKDVYEEVIQFQEQNNLYYFINREKEDVEFLKSNYLIALLLLMFDNDKDTGKEDYLLQLIVQSMNLGLLENIVYSIWEALKKFINMYQTIPVQMAGI